MKRTLITLTTFAAMFALAPLTVGCVDDVGPGYEDDIDPEDQWPDEPIEDPADEEEVDDSDGLAAVALKSCDKSFDAAWPNGYIVSGTATARTVINNGVAGINAFSYRLRNGHPFAGGNNKIGVRFQTRRNGTWKNATDWVFWERNLGTSTHDDYIGLGVRTTLPVRARVRFSWDVRWGKDPAKSCYIRIQ